MLASVARHAKEDHGMDEVPAEIVQQVRENICEVAA